MTICCDNILTANMEIKKVKKCVQDDTFPKKKKRVKEFGWINQNHLLCTLMLFIYRYWTTRSMKIVISIDGG